MRPWNDYLQHKSLLPSKHNIMMQHQHFQLSCSYFDTFNPPLDMDVFMGNSEPSSSLNLTEDSSDVSSSLLFPTMSPDELVSLPIAMFPSEQYSTNSNDLDFNSNCQLLTDESEYVAEWMQVLEGSSEISFPLPHNFNFTEEGYEESLSSSMKYTDMSPHSISGQSSLIMTIEDMEVDNQSNIPCLLKAYCEAKENDQVELAEVILKRIIEKANPIGDTMERLTYYLFHVPEKQEDYLQQEARKNHGAVFRAFYQILPHGRFAHLTANSAILESIPGGIETVHIVDFDLGDGVQLPPFIEALAPGRAVRLTSIKWEEECNSSEWSFLDTKQRLQNHARSLGVKLEVEEMSMEELVLEKSKMKTMNIQKEWLVFNCMVGLPHIGRQRSRREVTEFLDVAKELIYCKSGKSTRGIITLAEGDGIEERLQGCCDFGSFLNMSLVHFHALFQSVEGHFDPQLTEARTAIECLFLAPYILSSPCFGKWEDIKRFSSGVKPLREMGSSNFSRENLLQAKEIVKEGNSMYSVKLEGVNHNEMSLQWKGTPLVKVSTWT